MMTQADRDRLVALKKAVAQAITQRQAAEELDIGERQVRRLVKKLRGGDKQLQHALRGQPSNCKIDEAVEKQAVGILSQEVYRGFGPTLTKMRALPYPSEINKCPSAANAMSVVP